MQFSRRLSHASFSGGRYILVKRVQLALRDIIQFLVISQYTQQGLLCG